MFKYLLYFLFGFLIYRGLVKPLFQQKKSKKQRIRDVKFTESTEARPTQVLAESLHKCPTCATYNSVEFALHAQGAYYCDQKCLSLQPN